MNFLISFIGSHFCPSTVNVGWLMKSRFFFSFFQCFMVLQIYFDLMLYCFSQVFFLLGACSLFYIYIYTHLNYVRIYFSACCRRNRFLHQLHHLSIRRSNNYVFARSARTCPSSPRPSHQSGSISLYIVSRLLLQLHHFSICRSDSSPVSQSTRT